MTNLNTFVLFLLGNITLICTYSLHGQEVRWQTKPATPTTSGELIMYVNPIQSLATPPFYVSLLGPVSGTRVLSDQPYTTTFTNLVTGEYTLQVQSGSCTYQEDVSIEYCGYLSPSKPSLGLACESPIEVLNDIRVTEAVFPLLEPNDFPNRKSLFAVWGRDECLFDTGENGLCSNSEVIYSLKVGTEDSYLLTDSQSSNIFALYSELPIVGTLEYIPVAISEDPNFTAESTLIVCDSSRCGIALSANDQTAESQLLTLDTALPLNLYSIDGRLLQNLQSGQSPYEYLRFSSSSIGVYVITNEAGTLTSKIFFDGQ